MADGVYFDTKKRTSIQRNEGVLCRVLQDELTDELVGLAGGMKKNSSLIQDALRDSHKVSDPDFRLLHLWCLGIPMSVMSVIMWGHRIHFN